MNNPSRILFAGDPHGNFRPLIEAVISTKPEAVILLGDCDLLQPLENYLQEIIGLTDIWWIAGNHDFESAEKYEFLFHSTFSEKTLHLRVREVAGLKIAGLSGIFLGRVWYPPQPPRWYSKQQYLLSQRLVGRQQAELSLKYQSAIWPAEFEALKNIKADILVTHEAPGSHNHGFKAISDLAAAMQVKMIFHGHLHENYAFTLPNQVQVYGVADKSVFDLAGNLVAQIIS
ncbi:MAG: metallophosphoesterase [Methylococcaceae bacterium]|jgi:predicted phosphodiesterase